MKYKTILGASAIILTIAFTFINFYQHDAKDASVESPEPTTAEIKSIDGGPGYLRLEQVHASVTARFLITCLEGDIYWNAGIVTTPDLSSLKLKRATKNYLEIDDTQILIAQGDVEAKAVDSTLWILRPLDAEHVAALKKADVLGAWIEDGSDFRWGAFMHIGNVRKEINDHLEKCKK